MDPMNKRAAMAIGLMVIVSISVARAQMPSIKNYGDAATAAIAQWLPHFGAAQQEEVYGVQPVITGKADYFACGDAPQSAAFSVRRFQSATAGCPALQHGQLMRLQVMGMDHGVVFYDAAHRIVFFWKGCCSVASYVLASGVAPPPKPMLAANLGSVRTRRGVSLGMSLSAVTTIYGRNSARPLPGAPGAVALWYASGKIAPPTACSQNQIFAFKNGRLYYIELLMGC